MTERDTEHTKAEYFAAAKKWHNGWSRERKLTALQQFLLSQLFHHFNQDHYLKTGELKAFPSQMRLAQLYGVKNPQHPEGVRKALNKMQELGIIRINGSGLGAGRGITNHYIGRRPPKRLFEREYEILENTNSDRASSRKTPTRTEENTNSRSENTNFSRKNPNKSGGPTLRKELKYQKKALSREGADNWSQGSLERGAGGDALRSTRRLHSPAPRSKKSENNIGYEDQPLKAKYVVKSLLKDEELCTVCGEFTSSLKPIDLLNLQQDYDNLFNVTEAERDALLNILLTLYGGTFAAVRKLLDLAGTETRPKTFVGDHILRLVASNLGHTPNKIELIAIMRKGARKMTEGS